MDQHLTATASLVQVLQNSSPEVLSAALQLLASACSNSTTLEQLAQQQQLLATVLDQLSSSNPAVCAAAIELLYTASTAAVVRQELCKQLLTNHHLPTGDNATSGLDALWASCAATETLSAGVQVCDWPYQRLPLLNHHQAPAVCARQPVCTARIVVNKAGVGLFLSQIQTSPSASRTSSCLGISLLHADWLPQPMLLSKTECVMTVYALPLYRVWPFLSCQTACWYQQSERPVSIYSAAMLHGWMT